MALILTVGFSLGYLLFAFISIPTLLPESQMLARTNFLPHPLPEASLTPRYAGFLIWERFDTIWYTHIAEHGYDRPMAIVFFPLYPILIRLLTLTGLPAVAAAVLVTRVATFFLLWGLLELFRLDLKRDDANLATMLTLVWPGGFILFAAYPESLLGASMVWSLLCARRGRWYAAGILGALAGVTKAVGALTILPLLLLAGTEWRKRLLPLAITACGAVAHPGWLWLAGYPPLATVYRKYWLVVASPPWKTLWDAFPTLFTAGGWMSVVSLSAMVLVAVAVGLRRVRPEYAAFAAACLLLYLTKKMIPPFQSTLRYLLVVFPAFASLALLLRWRFARITFFCLAQLANLVGLFGFWSWALLF